MTLLRLRLGQDGRRGCSEMLVLLMLVSISVVVVDATKRNNSPSAVSFLERRGRQHDGRRQASAAARLPSFHSRKHHGGPPLGRIPDSSSPPLSSFLSSIQRKQEHAKRPTTRTILQGRFDLNLALDLRGGGALEGGGGDLFSTLSSTVSLSLQEEDNSNSSMIQNAIQSLLNMMERQVSPSLASTLRGLLENVQNVLGIQLLPPPKKKKKSKSKKGKKAAMASSKKKKTKRVDVGDDDEDPVSSSKKKTKKKAVVSGDDADDDEASHDTSTTRKSKSKATTKNKKKNHSDKKSSAAIQAHLKKPLKTTSPNYRIQRELQAFMKDPPPNLSVKVGSKNIRVWIVTMHGAPNTIYEGETFQLRIRFPDQYPTVPPSVYFLPPHIPLHEHVYTNGDICLSLLGSDWRPTMTAQSIAVSILSILSSAQSKSLPMDNARHAQNKPGAYQQDWVYHDDNC